MTQQEYENRIKELEQQVEELKSVKVAEQPKRWKPKECEEYWTVDVEGQVDCVDAYPDEIIEWDYLTGNCFKTKEEAEEYKKQIEYTAQYKNYIEEHSEPIDWNNNDQAKYYACFQQNELGRSKPVNYIYVEFSFWRKIQGTIYASSEKIILDAIKEIGEDNFKKYVLGVK